MSEKRGEGEDRQKRDSASDSRTERAALASEVARLTALVGQLGDEASVLREALAQEGEGDPTRQQLEMQLCDVQKLASVGVLAHTIAHDFNNQLTIILGNCSLAQADLQPDSPLHQRLDRVREAARRSAGLAEQLFGYSGTPAGSRKPIHLPHLLENMSELLNASVGKHCELLIEGPPQLPHIQAEETQMQQLIVNLVTNASEALEHEPGRAWIRLGVERVQRDDLANAVTGSDLTDGDYVYLEVEDDGSGIAPEDLGRLFEPFFSSKSPGRGLGLAAVSKIVKSHGGAIKLESVPGKGTKLRILFPQAGSRLPTNR